MHLKHNRDMARQLGAPNIGVTQKLCKVMLHCYTNNEVIKSLFARPVIETIRSHGLRMMVKTK